MTAAPARLIVSFAVDTHHRLTAEIESHGDGRHAVTVTRWIAGRQLEPAVRVPAVTLPLPEISDHQCQRNTLPGRRA